MDNEQEYRRARHAVRAIRGFYVHLVVFVLVMAYLFIINVTTGGGWWVQWPFFGWGLALAIHAATVFGLGGWLGPDWEDRKIKEIMDKKTQR
jgi:hypothetical protein